MATSGDSVSDSEFSNVWLVFLLLFVLILFSAVGIMLLFFLKDHVRKFFQIQQEADAALNDARFPAIDDQVVPPVNLRIFSATFMSRFVVNEPWTIGLAVPPSYEEASGLPTYDQAVDSMRFPQQFQCHSGCSMAAGMTLQSIESADGQ